MSAYPDTSYLCALFREQDHTVQALEYDEQRTAPLWVSTLLEFEFKQSIRLQTWLHFLDKTKGYNEAEAGRMLADWEADVAGAIIKIISVDMDEVLNVAHRLSSRNTPLTGNRTLDILHVATAVHLGATDFLTFDARQKKLAQAAGLKTPL